MPKTWTGLNAEITTLRARLDSARAWTGLNAEITTLRARLDSARELLNWIAQESISFDEANSGRQIGNPGLRGLLIEPGDITHRRIDTWLAEDGKDGE